MNEDGKGPASVQVSTTARSRRTFKVIMIGDPNVGKTCLSFRFCNGRFPARTEATIGVDFRERGIRLEEEDLRVQLWDTAGQERFRQSMVSHYYRKVDAVVFVYDMTKRDSFLNLRHWVDECRKHDVTPGGELPMILVGNKCDINDQLVVGTNEAQKFADHLDMPLFETSAKADSETDHVESIFLTLVHKLKDRKQMHVQSEEEREANSEATRILRASQISADSADSGGGYCCV